MTTYGVYPFPIDVEDWGESEGTMTTYGVYLFPIDVEDWGESEGVMTTYGVYPFPIDGEGWGESEGAMTTYGVYPLPIYGEGWGGERLLPMGALRYSRASYRSRGREHAARVAEGATHPQSLRQKDRGIRATLESVVQSRSRKRHLIPLARKRERVRGEGIDDHRWG